VNLDKIKISTNEKRFYFYRDLIQADKQTQCFKSCTTKRHYISSCFKETKRPELIAEYQISIISVLSYKTL